MPDLIISSPGRLEMKVTGRNHSTQKDLIDLQSSRCCLEKKLKKQKFASWILNLNSVKPTLI